MGEIIISRGRTQFHYFSKRKDIALENDALRAEPYRIS